MSEHEVKGAGGDAEFDPKGSDVVGKIIGGIIFLPSVLVAGLFYIMLRFFRLPLVTVTQIYVALQLVVVALWGILDVNGGIFAFLKSPFSNYTEVVPAVILVLISLGGLLGVGVCWWEMKQMKNNPHRVQLEGGWQYQFKFRRSLAQTLSRKKKIKGLKDGLYLTEDKVPLGIQETNDSEVVSRYYAEAATHTLVVGASGSGKSITLQSLIRGDIVNSNSTIVIDFKRDPEFASKVSSWTKEMGGNFYHFVNGDPSEYDIKNSRGQSIYDPLATGSPTVKADMVLGMREYDTASAVYKANMQQLLQVVFSMLHYANRAKAPNIAWGSGGLFQLATAISGDNFHDLAIACEGTPIQTQAEEVTLQLKGKTGLKHAMDELQGQIRTIVASDYGRWMEASSENPAIDLMELMAVEGNVVMFSLNSDSEPEFAAYVGAMILADITNVSAKRRNMQLKNKIMVYVDEFQAVVPTSVKALLEKSRGSAIGVTLAQQSFEQTVSASPSNGEAHLLGILDTCSNFIVHNGMTEDSAVRLAKIVGKHVVTKYIKTNENSSFFLSLNWSNKRSAKIQTKDEEAWIYPPREFMSLTSPSAANEYKSTAVVINKNCVDPLHSGSEGATARKVWMIPDSSVLEEYYDGTHDSSHNFVDTSGGSTISFVQDFGESVDLVDDQNAWNINYGDVFSPNTTQDEFIATAAASEDGEWGFQPLAEDGLTESDSTPPMENGIGNDKGVTVDESNDDFYEKILQDPLSQFSSENISPPPSLSRDEVEDSVQDVPNSLPKIAPPSSSGGLPTLPSNYKPSGD